MIKYRKFCPSTTWSLTVADAYGKIVKHTILEMRDNNSNTIAGVHISSFCGFKHYRLLWIDGSTYIHFNSRCVRRVYRRIRELDLRKRDFNND